MRRNNNGYIIEHTRKEASSKTIYKTIYMVETALGIEFPRGNTPSESREIMIETLADILR